jgi:hypothetical protein
MKISAKPYEKLQPVFLRTGTSVNKSDELIKKPDLASTDGRHYPDANASLEALVNREIAENLRICGWLAAENDDAVIQLFFILLYIKDFFKKVGAGSIADLKTNHPLIYQHIQEHKYRYLLTLIKNNVMKGREDGVYRDDFSVDPITVFILENAATLVNEDLFSPEGENVDHYTEEIFACLIGSMVTPAGRELIQRYKNQYSLLSLINKTDQPFWDH